MYRWLLLIMVLMEAGEMDIVTYTLRNLHQPPVVVCARSVVAHGGCGARGRRIKRKAGRTAIAVIVVERYRTRIRTRVPIGIASRPDVRAFGLPEAAGTNEIGVIIGEIR